MLFSQYFVAHRYDYENCEDAPAQKVMENVEKLTQDPSTIGKVFSYGGKSYTVDKADNFEYVDPIDKSISKKQVKLSTKLKL